MIMSQDFYRYCFQNNGNILTVRCSSTNETNDWYRAIKRQTLISTPVTTPVKVSSLLESPPVSIAKYEATSIMIRSYIRIR